MFTGELKSSLTINDSCLPELDELTKKCRITALRAITLYPPTFTVVPETNNIQIVDLQCSRFLVMASDVCLSLGITSLSVSQAILDFLKPGLRFPMEIEGTWELSLMLPLCKGGADSRQCLLIWRATGAFLAGPRWRGSTVLAGLDKQAIADASTV